MYKLLLLVLLIVAPLVHAADQPKKYIIDVRTDDEWNAGHIAEAIHIPLSDIKDKIAGAVKDKKAPIALYCASGMRSGRALRVLKDLGYENVENLGSLAAAKKKLAQP